MSSRKIALIFFVNIFRAGISAVALYFVAHCLGPTSLGAIAFALSFLGLFISIPDLGFNAAHIKHISAEENLSKCIGTFITIKFILITLMILFLVGAISFQISNGAQYRSQEQLWVIFFLFIYTILISISDIFQVTFEARRESAKQQISSLLSGLIQATLAIIISLGHFGVVALSSSYVIGALILLISSFTLFHGYPISKPSKDYLNSYFHFALPLSIYSIIVYANANLDKIIIGYFYDVNNVAYYFCGQQINSFIIALSSAVGMLLFPSISSFHSKNDFANIRKLTYISERYLSMIIAPIVILCIALAGPIINILFGNNFLQATQTFRILLIATFLTAINIPHEKQLPGINRPGLGVKVGIICAVLNTIINMILIPEQLYGIYLFGLGGIGAALSAVLSYLPRFVMMRYYTYKLTQTKFDKCILSHLLAASIPGIAIYYLFKDMIFTIWQLFSISIIFAVIYMVILYVVSEIKKSDFIYAYNSLHPIKMVAYIHSEIKNVDR